MDDQRMSLQTDQGLKHVSDRQCMILSYPPQSDSRPPDQGLKRSIRQTARDNHTTEHSRKYKAKILFFQWD